MRTSVQLDDSLLAEFKLYAAETGQTLTTAIEDALPEVLARRRNALKRGKVRLPIFPAGKLQPGVDLDERLPYLT